MARQRFIWPAIWDDPDLGRLPEPAMLLYIGCFSLADDEGRLIGDPVYLKTAVFRYRKASPEQVRRWRDQIAQACSHYRVYTVDEIDYVAFTNWDEYQHPKYPKPSKHPAPPGHRKRRKPAKTSDKPSGSRSGSRSRSDSTIGQGRAGLGTSKAETSTVDAAAGFQNGYDLPLLGDTLGNGERFYEVEKLVAALRDRDPKTMGVLLELAAAVPMAKLVDLRERAERAGDKGAGWAVNALKGETT